MRKLTHDQWLKEGTSLFGKDFDDWAFVCPVCGHTATMRDFTLVGEARHKAYNECIGRYTGGRSAFSDQTGKPCDYTAHGLLNLCTSQVVAPNGELVSVFEFAKQM